MGMTLAEMGERMTEAEFRARWVAYRIEPWGERRQDVRNALLCHVIAASQVGSEKAPAPDAFLHDFWAVRKQSGEGADG